MDPQGTETFVVWPTVVYFVCVAAVVAGMIGVSYVLGQRHRDRTTGEPYECGIVSKGTARIRFVPDYFLIAIFFVVFDLEAVFIFAWATAALELGWMGYGVICVFIGLLLAALGYLWHERALDLS